MTATKWSAPQAVSGVDVAFGGDMRKLLPPMTEIPDQFKSSRNPWVECVSRWFFSGLSHPKFTMRGDIDQRVALSHIKAIIGSFDPAHEHKEAGCAYLMSLWFEKVEWDGGSAQ